MINSSCTIRLYAQLVFDGESSVKGTASIKMREIDPSHVKETSFTCSLVQMVQRPERPDGIPIDDRF